MGDFSDGQALVSMHVRALREVSTDLYEAALFAHCWPGGCEDRFDPISVEWMKRWSPATLRATRLDCACAEPGCASCN